jgi:hypothetical protein
MSIIQFNLNNFESIRTGITRFGHNFFSKDLSQEIIMSEVTNSTTYFKELGEMNTARTIELARERAVKLGIHTILVASTSGTTGALAAQILTGFELIVISHSTGFRKPDVQELTDENRNLIEAGSARIFTGVHVFGGINRAIRLKYDTYQVDEIIANTLRIFGQGMKVAFEIAVMAADAGIVRTDTPIVCITGTNVGADTAIALIPTHTQTFFDLKILEIICMPSPRHP